MVRAEAVPNGKACGCICPECRGSLVAKNAGSKVRPHFSHMPGQGSDVCRETAIHLMAKQILASSRQVMLPAWERHYSQCDISGQSHHCEEIWAAKPWAYTYAKEEVWKEGLRPDVLLSADSALANLPLLVEVKVSHAVDDNKAELVRKRGWAMVEIDLSKVPEDSLAPDLFEELVLVSAPRKWIHAPKAEQQFAVKREMLDQLVAATNDELRKQGVEELDEFGRTKTDRARHRRIETLRSERRKPFLADIEALQRKTLPEDLMQLEEMRRAKDERAIHTLLERHSGQIPWFVNKSHKDAWVVNSSSARWQLAVAERFIYQASEGRQVSSGVVSRWVAEKFGIDEQAGRLIEAQRKDRERRKRRGDTGHDLQRGAWFFEEWENRLVPSLFHAVDALMGQLVSAGLLIKHERWTYAVDGPLGRESRRIVEEQRAARAEEAQRLVAEAEEKRQRLASIQMQTSLEQRQRRIEFISQAYESLAQHERQCLDCQTCRWPRPTNQAKCGSCGSVNGDLIQLDAQRLREIPHRLRSDPRVMGWSKYPFE